MDKKPFKETIMSLHNDHDRRPIPRRFDEALAHVFGFSRAQEEARQSRRELRTAKKLVRQATSLTHELTHHVESRAALELALGELARGRVEQELDLETMIARHGLVRAQIERELTEVRLRTRELAWEMAAIDNAAGGIDAGQGGTGKGATDPIAKLVREKREALALLREAGHTDGDTVFETVRQLFDAQIIRLTDA
jgi:hypothetical protein